MAVTMNKDNVRSLVGSELGSRRIGGQGFRRVLAAVLLVAAFKLLFT